MLIVVVIGLMDFGSVVLVVSFLYVVGIFVISYLVISNELSLL